MGEDVSTRRIREDVALHDLLAAAFAKHADKLAVQFHDERYTFGDLDRLSDAYRGVLQQAGLGPGRRMAIMATARPQFVVAALSALKLGAAVVLVSPAWKRGEIAHALGLSMPTCVACDADFVDVVRPEFAGPVISLDDTARDDLPAPVDLSAELPATAAQWLATEAALVFSSGTTGIPKAVVHTHATIGAGTRHWADALGLSTSDRFQIATPPSHILGLLNILAAIASGSTVRLHTRFNVDEMLRCIEADKLTLEMAVAPIALALADHPSIETFDLSSLRYIMWCATPVVPLSPSG